MGDLNVKLDTVAGESGDDGGFVEASVAKANKDRGGVEAGDGLFRELFHELIIRHFAGAPKEGKPSLVDGKPSFQNKPSFPIESAAASRSFPTKELSSSGTGMNIPSLSTQWSKVTS